MQPLAEPVSNLIEAFSQLPGIGPKTASRLTYFLLRSDSSIATNLATALEELRANTLFCTVCHNIADKDPCGVCASEQRDRSLICVVEEPLDVQAIERTREYMGLYHVLHGAISPVDGIGPDDLRIPRLLGRIADEGIREVILALNATVDGQTTAHYIAEELEGGGVSVTSLAQGVPIGGELDYLDDGTISAALRARKPV
jgi:recombination protein RecR